MKINAERFIQRRKECGISQTALTKGICTQSTVSKFESRGQVPSLMILNKLCERLDISIDDLDDEKMNYKNSPRLLDRVEELMMLEHYRPAVEMMEEVTEDQIKGYQDKMQFFYLRGMMDTLTNSHTSDTVFNFTQILDKLDEMHRSIYSQLAYLGLGILYARQDQLDKADFFFGKVIRFLDNLDDKVLEVKAKKSYYNRVIMMFYYVAEYENLRERYLDCGARLAVATDLSSQRSYTFFMPRIKLLAANNAVNEEQTTQTIVRYLDEAIVFARFNKNNVVELQATALKKEFNKI
ncbi:MAG: helix-turn-helix transcriptional regulator [Limosilactobacillus sp.]|uniref:helix-turn-helix domain-containing protein n=1 Tax=Limosilactobacillus sp. TaxID=2773925 RepID=UPI0027069003|nr:helix-turn-helix transcriptional regulator [Limosilactobacillus sp.]